MDMRTKAQELVEASKKVCGRVLNKDDIHEILDVWTDENGNVQNHRIADLITTLGHSQIQLLDEINKRETLELKLSALAKVAKSACPHCNGWYPEDTKPSDCRVSSLTAKVVSG